MDKRGEWTRGAALRRRWRGLAPILALPLLNVADALLTSALLDARLITEANPVMRMAWEASPGTFLAAKMGLVNLGTLGLWIGRRQWLAAVALLVSLATYCSVVGYQVAFVGSHLLSQVLPMP